MSAIPVLASIAGLADTSDLWFVDIWGVMHNGVQAFPKAAVACERFRQRGGTVLLPSNAPRPRAGVAQQLAKIGVPLESYDGIVTSGDVSLSLIDAYRGQKVLHIGPERDLGLFDGLGAPPQGTADDADVAVCTGLYDDTSETPADYADMLAKLKARDVPMICANPDITVERGGRIIYCAGAIAVAYAKAGGTVDFAGKPYLPIYDMAVDFGAQLRGASIEKGRVLAIGDGVATDIAGAHAFGIRSVYVASGVHLTTGEELGDGALRLFGADSSARPVAVMPELNW